jgi:hypothetical protein
MTTEFNETFKRLLTEYNLPDDLSFSVDLPTEVQKIIDDEIVINDLGITLKSFGGLHRANESWDNQSFVEDNENHFHVDWYIDPPDNKQAFILGVHTLTLLADKFQQDNIKGIRFFLSFQTPELGQQWAKENNLYEEGDEHYIGDRLSFHTRRDGEEVITIDKKEKSFWAILIIDI